MKRTARALLLALTISLLVSYALEQGARGYVVFATPGGKPYVWNLTNNVIRWNVVAGAPAIARESMVYATQTWAAATDNVLRFEEAPGGISVEWDPTGTKQPDAISLAYTTFSVDANLNIASARITVNALNYTWHRDGYGGVGPMVGTQRDANLDSVILHEVGHALGLDHCDKNAAAIVGAVSSGNVPTMNSIIYDGAQTLHLDDQTGIRALYNGGAAAVAPALAVSASPAKGAKPLTVSFANLEGSSDTVWDFGDGMTTMGGASSHRFTIPGIYTVTAQSNGRSTTVTIEVEKKGKKQVKAPKPPKRLRKKPARQPKN